MKQTNIKLSEAQLADLFKNQSNVYTSQTDANDCLGATAASANRLNHVEEMANDYAAAQGMKASFALRDWAEVVSESIENSRRSWFSFLGMDTPLKTVMATASFAFVFAFALPIVTQYSNQEPIHIAIPQTDQTMVHDGDIINRLQFDSVHGDSLSRGGFDGNNQSHDSDGLFNANFG